MSEDSEVYTTQKDLSGGVKKTKSSSVLSKVHYNKPAQAPESTSPLPIDNIAADNDRR